MEIATFLFGPARISACLVLGLLFFPFDSWARIVAEANNPVRTCGQQEEVVIKHNLGSKDSPIATFIFMTEKHVPATCYDDPSKCQNLFSHLRLPDHYTLKYQAGTGLRDVYYFFGSVSQKNVVTYSRISRAEFMPCDPTTPVYKDTITKEGSTVRFDKPMRVGIYANLDWWVHVGTNGTAKVIEIKPASVNAPIKHNGAMINPRNDRIPYDPNNRKRCQGFRSSVEDNCYRDSLNVALEVGIGNKSLTVRANDSLITTVTHAALKARPAIWSAAVTTFVEEIPKVGCFRPPFAALDKTCKYGEWSINYAVFSRHQFPTVANKPAVKPYIRKLRRVHAIGDYIITSFKKYLMPDHNSFAYGDPFSTFHGEALLLLNSDIPNSEKKDLAIAMGHRALDMFEVIQAGAFRTYDTAAGHHQGRTEILLAMGLALNHQGMLNIKADQRIAFNDKQAFYVSKADVDMTHSSRWRPDLRGGATAVPFEDYPALDRDKPWYGNDGGGQPGNNNTLKMPYLMCCTAKSWIAAAFALHSMKLRSHMKNPAYFDWLDYYVREVGRQYPQWLPAKWVIEFWNTYRGSFGPQYVGLRHNASKKVNERIYQ